jgi:hypothetical protein
MSIARLGGDGSSIIPMKSLSAFMYALLRMLPASLIADCSISPSSLELPGPAQHQLREARRRRLREDEQRATGEVAQHVHEDGRHRLFGAEICGGTSSSRDTLIVGTLIMIVRRSSATAPWPRGPRRCSRLLEERRAAAPSENECHPWECR